jgi:glycosyltransferase involved in cell wall biosynthesis
MSESDITIEHIVVDGGSTDGTIELLQEQESNYNLRWISEEDRGQSHAVNKGIKMSEGSWLGWQNSDDYYTNNCANSISDYINKQQLDIIYGDQLISNSNSEIIDEVHYPPPSRWNKYIQRYWINSMSNQSFFIRRSAVENLGMLSESYNYIMDLDLFEKILKSELNISYIAEFLGVFRRQPLAKTAGTPTVEHQKEKNELYNYSTVENICPNYVQTIIGFGIYSMVCLYTGNYKNIHRMFGRYL